MFLMHTICRSQTRNELEKQRMQIIRDIEKTSKELEKTKSSKATTPPRWGIPATGGE